MKQLLAQKILETSGSSSRGLKSFNHPLRLGIIYYLYVGKPSTVKEVTGAMKEIGFKFTQPLLSQHLSALRQLGYISVNHDGDLRKYSLKNEKVGELIVDVLPILFRPKTKKPIKPKNRIKRRRRK